MITHIHDIQLSLSEVKSLGELAELSGTPWAAWVDSGWVYAIFGGRVESLTDLVAQRTRSTSASATTSTSQRSNHSTSASPQLGESDRRILDLAWRLTTPRFDPERPLSEENLWPSWGDAGQQWSPEYSIRFSYADGSGVIARDMQARERRTETAQITRVDRASSLDLQREDSQRRDSEESLLSLLIGELLSARDERSDEERLRSEVCTKEIQARDLVSPSSAPEIEGRASWRHRVAEIVMGCEAGRWNKVVLARAMRVIAPDQRAWSAAALWESLSQYGSHDAHAIDEVPFIISLSPRERFVGRSPERLFSVEGSQVKTHALAGTRDASGLNTQEVQKLASSLIESDKDVREQALVVSWIEETLKTCCDQVEVGPLGVKRAGHLLHLNTSISAHLGSDQTPLTLLEALHPTPALGGHPQRSALEQLRASEPMDRGAYGAAWMWSNGRGDATAVVGIRAALLAERHADVFAGAGVVSGSDPDTEWEETHAKGQVIMRELDASMTRPLNLVQRSRPARSLSRACALVIELVRSGARGAVISPGSRNTPLALALDALIPTQIAVDERVAGFTALGWARAANAPILLCCTSGSAGAHYLPAITEAFYSGIPLIALTADRPPRLRGRGAPQTMWQHELYGRHVKRSLDLHEAEASSISPEASEALWRLRGASASRVAQAYPRGPVHLNVPFEEPLWDPSCDELLLEICKRAAPSLSQLLSDSATLTPNATLAERSALTQLTRLKSELSDFIHALDRAPDEGLICCGPLSPQVAALLTPALEVISSRLGWPICAEGSAQLRGQPHAIPCLDLIARCALDEGEPLAVIPRPEEVSVILFVGVHTHSRAVRAWLEETSAASYYWVGESPETSDPLELGVVNLGSPVTVASSILSWATVQSDLERVRGDLVEERPQERSRLASHSHWRARWLHLAQVERSVHAEAMWSLRDQLWGGSIGGALCALTADHPDLDITVASSMAFRDHDLTWRPARSSSARVWVNRGLNGIDGTLSSALGAAQGALMSSPVATSEAPIIIWLGDLAAHHDLQGFHALAQWRRTRAPERPVIVLLTNNDGGGIFYHLPIQRAASFERLFVTSQHSHVSKDLSRDQAEVTLTEQVTLHEPAHSPDEPHDEPQSPWRAIAAWARVEHREVASVNLLREALDRATQRPALTLIEAKIDASLDHQAHLAYWRAAQEGLMGHLRSPTHHETHTLERDLRDAP